MNCTLCKGREGAHYGWCSQVNGPGYSPTSLEAAIARARRAAAVAPPAAAPSAPTTARKDTNNGWWNAQPNPSPSSPLPDTQDNHQPDVQECMSSITTESRQPRKSTSWNGDDPSSLHKDYRALIEPICREQGWTFVRQRGTRKPYVVSPDGRRFTLPITPDDSYMAIKKTRSQLRRMGAQL